MKQTFTSLLLAAFMLPSILLAQSPGNALRFDGTNDYVVCPLPTVFNNIGANDFTMEAWVYPQGAIFSRIVFAQLASNAFATMSTSTTNQIYFYVNDGTNHSIVTSAAMPQNQWTHVTARWTAATNSVQVFFNGVLQAGIGGGTSSTGTNNRMTIGARPDGTTQFFPGALDEIRIWNTARSRCEIVANMNATLTGTEPGLVAYYNFNQGVGGAPNPTDTVLIDSAGGHTGTLTNFALTGTTSNWITSTANITQTGPMSTPDVSVQQFGNTLFANSSTGTLQWLDCDNGFAEVPFETFQTFVSATLNGSFAVRVTENGCTDTSACFLVNPTGIADKPLESTIKLYPNPSKGSFTLELTANKGPFTIEVFDVSGRSVFVQEERERYLIPVQLDVPPGVYTLALRMEGKTERMKMVVE